MGRWAGGDFDLATALVPRTAQIQLGKLQGTAGQKVANDIMRFYKYFPPQSSLDSASFCESQSR